MDEERVARLEERLGWRFEDRGLLERAFVHASWAHEHPPALHQEGLAFVGDAALGLVVAERVFGEEPSAPVGTLSPRRAQVVSGANLARWAVELEVGALLRLGRGADMTGGRERESILATTLEAVLGVVYLEGGVDAVRRAVGAMTPW